MCTDNTIKREFLEKHMGCGRPVTDKFMPYPFDELTVFNTKCGHYVGDDGPAWCESCTRKIELIWDLEEDE